MGYSPGFCKELDTTEQQHMHIRRKIYSTKLAHMTWSLTSLRICRVSRQAGDQGEQMVSLQSESEGLRTRRANDISSIPRAGRLKGQEELVLQFPQKVGKSQHLSQQAVRREEFGITREMVYLFVFFRPSTDWMRPTHIGRAIFFT